MQTPAFFDKIAIHRYHFHYCGRHNVMVARKWKSFGTLLAGAVAMTLIVAFIVWWGYHAGQALHP